jgi:hypothetical protein
MQKLRRQSWKKEDGVEYGDVKDAKTEDFPVADGRDQFIVERGK